MPKISNDDLTALFSLTRPNDVILKESVAQYEQLQIHADGKFPREMITRRRPNEPEEIVKYREDTYKPVTKLPIGKVITSFGKIRRSADWTINFPKKIPATIIEEESLENYCTLNLPGYVSITDWAFGILLKQNLIDANAIIAVIPLEPIVENKYSMPVPILFNSDQVLKYREHEKYCVLKSRVGNTIETNSRYYYIDEKEVITYQQTKDGYNIIFQQANIIGQFPVWKVKSEAYKQFDNMSLNRSRLDAMVPFLDEMACEYSDLKASKIRHLYPQSWYYQSRNCPTCKGSGQLPGESGKVKCTKCTDGKIIFSPFTDIYVEPPDIGKSQVIPVPPGGVFPRDTVILELQEKSVEKNGYKALSAVNMQFLDQTPLSISGDAKNVDREELNNTVYNSAEDLVYSVDKTIFYINEWRYFTLIPDAAKRKEMLPNIPVPQNFDLLPEDYLMKEVTDARNSKINPLLIATLEQQLAAKKFYNQPDLAGNIKLYFDLDPLPGLSVEEKMSLISNKAITLEDFILSSYMASFIKRAIREDSDFASKAYDAQITVLLKYVKEKITANDDAQQMIDQQKQKVIDEMKNAQQQQDEQV